MKQLVQIIILMICFLQSNAQNSSTTYFDNDDIIQVELSNNSDYYYLHTIKKGHSIYALSKIFGVSVDNLMRLNAIRDVSSLKIGQKIKIPIQDSYLFKGTNLRGLKYGHYVPVYYQTKPKDNLFRISRIYFKQPTEDLVKRNNLKDNHLSLGQSILVGWFPIDSAIPRKEVEQREEIEEDLEIAVVETEEDESQDVRIEYNQDVTSELLESDVMNGVDSTEKSLIPSNFNMDLLGKLKYSESMKEIRKYEVANWDKTIQDNGSIYVLHKSAIIDSYIELYNPILRRTLKAKVIGRIPYGAYTKDVTLVLSPRTAKQLGAEDRRFKVEVKALIYHFE
ncbi:MAG: LysM peptidoglycan-binding domain-containing protein [Saprospiraceae bacterium]|nr:LysM peptidoglycan-binding domain-containing protein [Saprospiraceae bacterium]